MNAEIRAAAARYQAQGFLFVSQNVEGGVEIEVITPDRQKEKVLGATEDEAMARALRRAGLWGMVRQLGGRS